MVVGVRGRFRYWVVLVLFMAGATANLGATLFANSA